jgi:hypothetical protein
MQNTLQHHTDRVSQYNDRCVSHAGQTTTTDAIQYLNSALRLHFDYH